MSISPIPLPKPLLVIPMPSAQTPISAHQKFIRETLAGPHEDASRIANQISETGVPCIRARVSHTLRRMSIVAAPVALEKSQQDEIRTGAIVALWIASLMLLTLFLGNPPVTRTQEARVLETARQMLGRDAHEWLVPKLNGSLRLQKPPLNYWMSGASFRIGGVDEFWGRLP